MLMRSSIMPSATAWLDDQFSKAAHPPAPFCLSEFDRNRSLGYPHTNCFAENGRVMALAENKAGKTVFWRIQLDSGCENKICEFDADGSVGYYDVAQDAGIFMVLARNALWFYDLKSCSLLDVHHPEKSAGDSQQGIKIDGLPSITPDGREVVAGFSRGGCYGGYHVDVASGRGRILFEVDWYANHFHFCPHDRTWLGFSHEGRCDQIPDRAWAWHPSLAPLGKNIFDQWTSGKDRFMQIGHERWCFHDTSTLFVSFGSNPSDEQGVYEAYPDGRPPRHVYRGPAWHVNVSHDGRWAVVDTMGDIDAPDKKAVQHAAAIIVIDMKTGRNKFAARSRTGLAHPSHPHPAFSWDDRYIFYNEADEARKNNRVMCVPNPLWREVG